MLLKTYVYNDPLNKFIIHTLITTNVKYFKYYRAFLQVPHNNITILIFDMFSKLYMQQLTSTIETSYD